VAARIKIPFLRNLIFAIGEDKMHNLGNVDDFKIITDNLPKQTNTYDCGIFSMLFASYSIEGTLFEASEVKRYYAGS
jgi:Ulp1 family protease